MSLSAFDQIVADLTPEHLQQVILEVADQQPPGYRSGVGVAVVVKRLLADCPFASGVERSRAYLTLIEVIEKKLDQVDGIKLVRGSP